MMGGSWPCRYTSPLRICHAQRLSTDISSRLCLRRHLIRPRVASRVASRFERHTVHPRLMRGAQTSRKPPASSMLPHDLTFLLPMASWNVRTCKRTDVSDTVTRTDWGQVGARQGDRNAAAGRALQACLPVLTFVSCLSSKNSVWTVLVRVLAARSGVLLWGGDSRALSLEVPD